MLIGVSLVGAIAASGCTKSADDTRGADGTAPSNTEGDASTTVPADVDISVDVSDATLAATVSDRFQSFNLEMASVVGGTFWAPRDDPSGELMSEHPPVELDDRLTNLTAKLGPSYLRVSGSWANNTYFDESGTIGDDPPEGFKAVLTGDRWSEVASFAEATGNRLVSSMAVGQGTRAPDGSWTSDLASRFLRYTVDNDIPLDAVELINEPNIQATAGATYDAAGFARDMRTLRDLRDVEAPDLKLLGPGGMVVSYELPSALDDPTTEELLETSADLFDAFSFHSYTGLSSRCPQMNQVPVDRLMDRDVLAVPLGNFRSSTDLRDAFMPDSPIWLTETATAACGGDETAPTFEGAFAYLEHLGDAARSGIDVHMYNTLVASDYGIIDDRTHMPRPSYWAAYLWKRLMGDRALDLGQVNPVDEVSLFGHCSVDGPSGAVTVLVSNRDAARSFTIDLGSRIDSTFVLSSDSLASSDALINGERVEVDDTGRFTDPEPLTVNEDTIQVGPQSLTFVTLPKANAEACS